MLIYILTAVVFLLMFSVLVSVHELGHYLAARKYGMSVSEFSIGMGPLVKTFGKKSYVTEEGVQETTDFNLRALPLGGFVKIAGMDHDPENNPVPEPGGFYAKHPWKRIMVLLAGPIFSLIFGWIIVSGVFMTTGETKGTNRVFKVQEGMPAAKAGIQTGDRVLSIDNRPVTSNTDGVKIIRDSGGKTLNFAVQRGDKTLQFDITPTVSEDERQVLDEDGIPTGEFKKLPQVGLIFDVETTQLGPLQAFGVAATYPYDQVRLMVKKVTHPKVILNNSTGVVGMAVITKEAVQGGLSPVFMITGLISLSLGIFNLLPIYPLDGGQIAISLIEWMRKGRQVSVSFRSALLFVGLFLMGSLFLFRIYKDTVQYVLPGKENVITGPAKPEKKSVETNAPAP